MDREAIERIAKELYRMDSISAFYWEDYIKERDVDLYLSKARSVLDDLKSLGCVQLDPDQSLPDNPHQEKVEAQGWAARAKESRHIGYEQAQQDMLNAGFKKVKK